MMTIWSNFHFIRPLGLLLIPIVVAVWWFWQRRTDTLRGWRAQIDPALLDALVVGRGAHRRWGDVGVLAAWSLAVVAIAGPTWKLEPNPFAEDALPLLVVMKSDDSMAASDVSPTRLERAKLKIADLAQARPGQPLGLLAYAGSAHLVLPATRDTQVVAQMAAELSPQVMPEPGDRLDLALAQAGELLRRGTGGSILVVADTSQTGAAQIAAAWKKSGGPAVQFLALAEVDAPGTQTLRQVADAIRGTVEPLSVDDQDIASVVRFAQRNATSSMAGESSRWQESGYWLTPVLALLVALSFRRRTPRTEDDA